jgi:hypothetical protein
MKMLYSRPLFAPLQDQLYQAWVQVAFDIAEIRQNMAVLSERLARRVREQEQYIEAMQTPFVLVHFCRQKMEYKDSYSDRKELHQEAIQLQNCLADVLDQNER